MRLLNVNNLYVEEFLGEQIPPYAILSHTWEDDEVSFAQIHTPDALQMKGFHKIKLTCKQAAEDGLQYAWIDTCCIDKTSSMELSEAINSMFSWYSRAKVCYAYLVDFRIDDNHRSLNESRWFTRGWTLQELIAPVTVKFFDSNWQPLGTKADLVLLISAKTGIDQETLLDPTQLPSNSIARRMSWASNRNTTRLEDQAYSLLGLFDVSMPLLYGEGENAFLRLQEQIMKASDDQSLFAWGLWPHMLSEDLKLLSDTPSFRREDSGGILARTVRDFRDSALVIPIRTGKPSSPYMITNKGLQIEIRIVDSAMQMGHVNSFHTKRLRIALLPCTIQGSHHQCLGIALGEADVSDVVQRIQWTLRAEFSKRVATMVLPVDMMAGAYLRTVYVQESRSASWSPRQHDESIVLRTQSIQNSGYDIFRVISHGSYWDEKSHVIRLPISEVASSKSKEKWHMAIVVFLSRIDRRMFSILVRIHQLEKYSTIMCLDLRTVPVGIEPGSWIEKNRVSNVDSYMNCTSDIDGNFISNSSSLKFFATSMRTEEIFNQKIYILKVERRYPKNPQQSVRFAEN
jgi:hypothetical protein